MLNFPLQDLHIKHKILQFCKTIEDALCTEHNKFLFFHLICYVFNVGVFQQIVIDHKFGKLRVKWFIRAIQGCISD